MTPEPTPRTDEVEDIMPEGLSDYRAFVKMREHARQLERELAAAKAERITEPLSLEEATWSLLFIRAKLRTIQEKADKARRKKSVDGHHCDFRAALDAVADIAKFELGASSPLSQWFRNEELKAEKERDDLKEQASRLAAALEEIRLHDGGNRYNYREITELADEALASWRGKGGEG